MDDKSIIIYIQTTSKLLNLSPPFVPCPPSPFGEGRDGVKKRLKTHLRIKNPLFEQILSRYESILARCDTILRDDESILGDGESIFRDDESILRDGESIFSRCEWILSR